MSPWSLNQSTTDPAWRPRSARWSVGWGVCCLGLVLGCAAIASAATPAGTVVTNQAQATVIYAGAKQRFESNPDQFEVQIPEPPRSKSAFGAYRVDGAGDLYDGWRPARIVNRTELGTLSVDGSTSDPTGTDSPPGEIERIPQGDVWVGSETAKLSPTTSIHAGQAVQLRVVDHDQNRYVTDIESVIVEVSSDSGETEEVELLETGKDTGVFAGYIILSAAASCTAHDGRLSGEPNDRLSITYTDARDPGDCSTLALLVDPFGVLFDSSSGEPIDGVAITLINEATGLPADVYGADGVSAYPATVVTGGVVRDAQGAIYEMRPGGFSFPFVRPGSYRYDIDRERTSGFTFPSTVPETQLQSLPGAPYALAAASTGGTFEVVLDAVKTDIPLDPTASGLMVSLTTPTTTAGEGDFVRFDLEITNRRQVQPFRQIVVSDQLPAAFRLEPKSLRREATPGDVELAADGRSFSWTIPNLAGGETQRFSYVVRVERVRSERAINSAFATAGAVRSVESAASVFLKDELQAEKAHVMGRVTRSIEGRATDEGLAGVAVFLETGRMAVTDARGFFRFTGLLPGTHVVQIDTTTLPRGARAVLPQGSTENAGRPWSRFADVAAGSLWTSDFQVELPEPDSAAAALTEAEAAPAPAAYDQAWIDAQPESFEWVEPNAATPLPTPAVQIVVKHQPAHQVRVTLNGVPVKPINFDGTMRSNHGDVAASRWSGVALREGDNTFEIVREDSFGIERGRETRVIHYAAPPVRAELVGPVSRLVADGLSPPVIAVRLFDSQNNPARAGTTGRFVVSAPFEAWRASRETLRLNPGAAVEPTTYTVGEDGLALIKLQPVTESGTVRIGLELVNGLHEIRADLVGHRAEWLVVGVAEGTSAWHTINGHLENARHDEVTDGFDESGRIAFFLKGRVRGDWLLTAAYDSAKEKPLPVQSLHGLVDPDAYYTVYGDESQQLENAPSTHKLYVKLERRAVVALLGDFSLDWSATRFTTYARDLHGAKVEYRGEKFRAAVFQSEAGLTHGRDEFRGAGLSGPYVLRRHPLVAFSERLILEERDRLRPDIVVSATPLARNVDYQIDALGGVVWLSQPLFPSSTALNPQFLVVHYELEDQTTGVVQGARVEYAPHDRVTVGASHVREERDTRTDSTSGLDASVQLSKNLLLKTEVARSDNAQGNANAYRAEIVHQAEQGQARVYFNEVGTGFGLNQLSEYQLGNRQFGFEGTRQLTPTITGRALAFQETILATGDQRRAAEAQLEWTRGVWSVRSGLRSSQDTRASTTESTHLLTSGISRRFLGDRIEFRVDREQSLAGESENLDFPSRTVVGVSYAATPNITVLAEQEWSDTRDVHTAVTRLGAKSKPWTGATLTGNLTAAQGSASATTLGTGLNQTIPLTQTLSVEGGLQRTTVLSGSGLAGVRSTAAGITPSLRSLNSGLAPGSEGASSSGFVGVHWKPGNVLYHLRAEASDLQGTRRTGLLASAQAEVGHDLGLLASVMASRLDSVANGALLTLDARLGAAWRPSEGSTTMLQRLDLVHVPGAGSAVAAAGWKVIENVHLNQRFGTRWQASWHLGAKYVFSGPDLESFTTLSAFEARVNVTPQWDVGLNAAVLSGWDVGTQQWSVGMSLGHTLATNLWMSLGYNLNGFYDADFNAARYTAAGVYVRFRLKFDQESLDGLLNTIKAE